MIGKIIQESLDDAKAKNISFEPLNPEQRLRKAGVPVGLKNVGNSKRAPTQPATSTRCCRPTSTTRSSSARCSRSRSPRSPSS